MCTLCFATQTFDPLRHDTFADSGFSSSVQGTGPVRAVLTEGADAAESTGTTYTMAIGDTFLGSISSTEDEDWIAIELTEGEVYSITLDGISLSDPLLTLYNSGGGFLATNDDGGPGLNSALTYTAAQTGTFYIEADAYSTQTGTYELAVQQVDISGQPGTVGTVEDMADFLTTGFWGGRQYTFDTLASNVITLNIAGLTSAGQQLAVWASEAWETVANLDFEFVTSGEMITLDDNSSGAYAYTPNPGSVPGGVELNISTAWISAYGDTIDSYSFQTFVHEFGHALGLGHQGAYNGRATYDFTGDVTFTNDSYQMSVLSYFDQNENTSINASFGYTSGPMMADIYAIQDLYGAPDSNSVTAGATTYGLGSNLGTYMDTVFARLSSGTTTDDIGNTAMVFTLYDRDGVDTLAFDFLDVDARLDLRDRSFSDFGDQIGVMGIAVDTVIENATLGSGHDTVTGNDADNTLTLGSGNDTAIGGNGDDIILGGIGIDTLYGGSGRDVLDGGDNTDRLEGGDGNDILNGGQGFDNLYGDAGNDRLFGGIEADRLHGGDGNDILRAGSNFGTTVDGLFGGEGNDSLYGDGGFDFLDGGAGDDYLNGGHQADNLYGRDGEDVLHGDQGLDRLFGGIGDDTAYGGDGNDGLLGGTGNDELHGDDGADRFFGGSGNDMIYGGAGADTINGGSGFDTIEGGTGNDLIFGRFNADTFIFVDGHGNDTIGDFAAQNPFERIDLSDIITIGALVDLQLGHATAGAATQVDWDVLIDTGLGNSITLTDVALTDLDAGDFIF